MLKRWIIALRRDNFKPTGHHRICSDHFTPDRFYKNRKRKKVLLPEAVPTKFNFTDGPKIKNYKIRKDSINPVIENRHYECFF
ncbi:hypothetical protein JTE90_001734 [Oedothorax gibbosus]|uniref:THAP-type domain-containing protein n=1 Tax=Oedothorax gibbosus TaxID=931172 RepID=A0AAV6V7Z8_9ARAC|nr:hypothetical protein JTE90_001734 [Oedothorax gibbosus]